MYFTWCNLYFKWYFLEYLIERTCNFIISGWILQKQTFIDIALANWHTLNESEKSGPVGDWTHLVLLVDENITTSYTMQDKKITTFELCHISHFTSRRNMKFFGDSDLQITSCQKIMGRNIGYRVFKSVSMCWVEIVQRLFRVFVFKSLQIYIMKEVVTYQICTST